MKVNEKAEMDKLVGMTLDEVSTNESSSNVLDIEKYFEARSSKNQEFVIPNPELSENDILLHMRSLDFEGTHLEFKENIKAVFDDFLEFPLNWECFREINKLNTSEAICLRSDEDDSCGVSWVINQYTGKSFLGIGFIKSNTGAHLFYLENKKDIIAFESVSKNLSENIKVAA